MSGYIPGMASPGVPLYEIDTSMIVSEGTPVNLSFPDVIPNFPEGIDYNVISPSPNPVAPSVTVSTYLMSVLVSIQWENPGDLTACLFFKLAGQSNVASKQNFEIHVPIAPFVKAPAGPGLAIISFTGLMSTLPRQSPKLFIASVPNTDTTTYKVAQAPIIKSKLL